MTTRPGDAIVQWMQKRPKTMRLCNLVRVVRKDGGELCFSDHDRVLTFEGRRYLPVVGAGMSADRREGGLKTSTQDVYGVIDGTHVVLPDLNAERFRGAEVFHVRASWRPPIRAIARHRMFVRHTSWTGSTFVGQLESRTQVLQRTSGGRFGGSFHVRCAYSLGDEFCRKDISSFRRSAFVTSIETPRMVVRCSTNKWPTASSDDFYRDGEIEWRWGTFDFMEVDRGTATATTSTTSLVDSTQAWTVNEHVGRRVLRMSAGWGTILGYSYITANTATTATLSPALTGLADGDDYMISARGISSAATATTLTDPTAVWVTDEHAGKFVRFFTVASGDGEITLDAEIASNTGTVLTFTAPQVGVTGMMSYDIAERSPNYGTISPITRHVDAVRELTLLSPTPREIEFGHGGWVNVGCDGLRTTCISKFNNVVNFGGDAFAPSGQQILEPPPS